jgi:toxin ParE1/3/4
MNRYIISPSASKDLNEISNYFFAHNIQAGEKLFLEFNKKCQKLTQFPKMGRSYAHVRPNLRGLPLQGYIIIYQVLENEVEILRVVHGSQDLELLLSEE